MRCLLMTVSIRNFVEYGRTRAATRLMSINMNPRASRPRRGRISSQTSGSTARSLWILGGFWVSWVGELNRKDSLQLLRIQNALNLLAVAMRDMVSNDEPYPLTAWSAQFQRIRNDLDDAMRLEAGFAAASRTPEQSAFLTSQFSQFWDAVDRIFALAREGKEKDAREQIQLSLQAREAGLSTAVARLLIQNTENEEQAGQRIVQIYDGGQRQV